MLRGGTTNDRKGLSVEGVVAALCVAAALFAADARAAPSGPRHWVDVGGDLPDEPVTAVAIDPVDEEVVLVGLDGFVFKTDDGGESWRPVLSFPRGVVAGSGDGAIDRPAGEGLVGTSLEVNVADSIPLESLVDAEVVSSVDDDALDDASDLDVISGESGVDGLSVASIDDAAEDALPEGDVFEGPAGVTLLRTSSGVRAIRFVKESPGTVWIATGRGLFRSVDRGEHFVQIELPGGGPSNDVRDLVVDPLRPSRLYLATASGLLVSRDGAATFQAGPGAVGATPGLSVAVDASKGDTQVLYGSEAGLFRSWDGGQTFLELLLKGAPREEPITALAFAVDGAITYAGTRSGLFASERGAAILERREALSGDVVTALSPHPTDMRAVAVGFLSTGVARSTNTGIEVLKGEDGLPAAKAAALARGAKDADALYVATDRGIFRSAPGTGIREDADRLQRLRARFAKEPDVQVLARAALLRAGLGPELMGDLALRARLAGLLPDVTATYKVLGGRTTERTFRLVTEGDVPLAFIPGVDDAAITGETGAFSYAPGAGVIHQVLVVAVWDLNRLVFDPNELRVAAVGPSVGAGQSTVVARVHELWAARRRLLAQVALGDNEPKGTEGLVRRRLQLQQLTAQLDAATGDVLTREAQKNGVKADDTVDLDGTEPEARGEAKAARRRTR